MKKLLGNYYESIFQNICYRALGTNRSLFYNHYSNLEPFANSNLISLYTYKVVNTYPHDQSAFTEGLVFEDGVLYEGTGLHGYSTLRKVKLTTGEILQIRELPPQLFGEGVAIYGNKIIQLTWQSNISFVYDKYSFKLLQEFNYPDEGWVLHLMGSI